MPLFEDGTQAQQRFAAWCEGQTGYLLVDAAMVQLNQTGYMHNRLRMVSGSFLVKHLGIDWRWASAILRRSSTTSKWLPTTAAGSGRSSGVRRPAVLPHLQPASAQSERFDHRERSFVATCHSWPSFPPNPSMPLEGWIPPHWKNAGIQLACIIRGRLWDATQARNRTLLRYAVVRKVIRPPPVSAQ